MYIPRNQSLFPAYLLQFRPNGQKTDMFRASEQQMDARNGIFGRFAVQNTMPDMFVWLEQRSDSVTSNFAPFGYSGGANLMPEQLDLHRARAHHQT